MTKTSKTKRRVRESRPLLLKPLLDAERYLREHYLPIIPENKATFEKARDTTFLALNKVIEIARQAGFKLNKGLTKRLQQRATATNQFRGAQINPYNVLVFATTLSVVQAWIDPVAPDAERDSMLKETTSALKSEKSRRRTLVGAGFTASVALMGKPDATNDVEGTAAVSTAALMAQINSMITSAVGATGQKQRPNGGGAQSHAATGGGGTQQTAGNGASTGRRTYVKVEAGTVIDTDEKGRNVIVAMKQDKALSNMIGIKYCMFCSYLAEKPTGTDHRGIVCEAKTAAAIKYATAHPGFNKVTQFTPK